MASSAILDASFGRIARAFSARVEAAAADATALLRTLYGLDDGQDYGRYFAGQDPLQPYLGVAGSLADMIAEGVSLRAAADTAAAALIAASSDTVSFSAAADGLCEALRAACADPRDGLRLLAPLCGFAMLRPASGIPGDGEGVELYVLSARAVLRCRIAAAGSLIRAVADYVPTSQQAAQLVRDRVSALLDALAVKCADLHDDRTAAALDRARAAIVADLDTRGADVAPVAVKSFGAALPAKVVANRLYGDASRAAELLARNDPPHPSFLPRIIEASAA